ncbi:glycosyltransferase, partial [Candidatus Woesearchaeota archaeon]|nr:glycosyltransferase [Candidatus Woesearchaeota archaeon]
MIKKKAIIIFIKYPELGKVKTRLASTTNDRFAVNIYKAISENIFYEVGKLSQEYEVFIFYSEWDNETDIKRWVEKKYSFRAQSGNDLGEKMSNA